MSWSSDERTGVAERHRWSSLLRVFSRQLLLLLLVAGGLATAQPFWSSSLFVGGLLQILPAVYFARRVFKFSASPPQPVQIAQAFYRGEMGKFLLTAVGFALVFRFMEPLHAPSLFAGFGLMLIAHIIGLARIGR